MFNRYRYLWQWFYRLSWKKIIQINVLMLLIVVIPISINLAKNPTRTKSEAALLAKPQPVTSNFETPTGPPKIFLVDHFFGKVGDAVLVHGENLGGFNKNSWLSLAGERIGPDNLIGWAGNYIEFKVPKGAQSGLVEVNVLGEKTSWQGTFLVTNEAVKTELRLQGLGETATLTAQGLNKAKELLIWFLTISGEGNVTTTAFPGIDISQREFDLPIGKINEVKLTFLDEKLTADSLLKFVPLVEVKKAEEQLIGIAYGQLTDDNQNLMLLQVHPLYISF